MAATITASAVRTCFGDGPATWDALVRGDCGVAPLRRVDPRRVGSGTATRSPTTGRSVPVAGSPTASPRRWPRPAWIRCAAAWSSLVGTGLRESAEVNGAALAGAVDFPAERLHFGPAVADAAPGVRRVVTLANACSAGGHALALAQDLVETGEADAVLVGGTDGSTASMLAMIGRVAARPTERVRPFDADRTGVLLGDGAAVLVVEADRPGAGLARLLGTGLSCDAGHETAPTATASCGPCTTPTAGPAAGREQVDLVLAHGTGTALNDATEAGVLAEVFAGCEPGPLVTALKGAVGHTSGGSALLSVAIAIEALRTGQVPPVVGLSRPASEARRAAARARPGRGGGAARRPGRRVRLRRPQRGHHPGGVVTTVHPGAARAHRRRSNDRDRPVAAVLSAALEPARDRRAGPAGRHRRAATTRSPTSRAGRRSGPPTCSAARACWPGTGDPARAVRRTPGTGPAAEGAPPERAGRPRTAVAVSSNLGNVATVGDIAGRLRDGGPREVGPLEAPNASSNVIAGAIAIWFRFGGPNLTRLLRGHGGAGRDLARRPAAARAAAPTGWSVVGAEPDDPQARALHAARRGATPGRPLRAGAAVPAARPGRRGGPAAGAARPGPRHAIRRRPARRRGPAGRRPLRRRRSRAHRARRPADRRHAGPSRVRCGDPVDGVRELTVRAVPR